MSKAKTARWGAAALALSLLAVAISMRRAPAQNGGSPTAPPASRVRQLLTVGDAIRAQDRPFGMAFFNQDPVQPGMGVSLLHRVTDDGSLFVSDYAGVSLIRLPAAGAHTAAASRGHAGAEVLLDSSRPDPVDGVALARIVTVETSRQGVSAIVALRADGTFGLYRLARGVVTRIVRYPDHVSTVYFAPLWPRVAISDAGQIAFVAPDARGADWLFQTTPAGAPVKILRAGEAVTGGVVAGIEMVWSNSAGDLTFSVFLRGATSRGPHAIFRQRRSILEQVVATGDVVEMARGAGTTRPLDRVENPRIGPDGTVVFMGGFPRGQDGSPSENLFVQRPGQSVEPFFDRAEHLTKYSSEYTVDADGAVAVVRLGMSVYLAPPGGGAELIVKGVEQSLIPLGGLTLDTRGNLFFLAMNLDLPRDRYGFFPIRLYQYQRRTGAVGAVQVGRAQPANLGLLTLTQPPVLSPGGVTVGAAFGDSDRFAVPRGGLFQLSADRPLADGGTLIAAEGEALTDAGRVGIPRNLSYNSDGSLAVDVFLPGGGTAVITLGSGASTASRARSQAAASSPLVPLVATGQSMGQPDRTLLSFLGDLVPLGVDQQLVTARYSQAGQTGEGLFAVSRTQRVELLADTLRGAADSRLTSFSEWRRPLPGLPSVSPEGNVAFGAFEDRGGLFPQLSVFQWLRGSGSVVKMLASHFMVIWSEARWQAGPAGTVYVLVPPASGIVRDQLAPGLYKCSLRPGTQEAQVEPLVVGGKTRLAGSPTVLQQVFDFVLDGNGELFLNGQVGVTGQPTEGKAGLFRWDPGIGGLQVVIREGDPLPRFADGRQAQGWVFGRHFWLLRDSARGPLFFLARTSRDGASERLGLFRRTAQGGLETLLVENLGVTGARDLELTVLSGGEQRQTANGNTVFSFLDILRRRWKIMRTRLVRDAGGQPVRDGQGNPRFERTVIAEEGASLGGGRRVASLNAQRLVPGYKEGPVFAVNDAGDVAFFASDGQRWGVYEYSDRP